MNWIHHLKKGWIQVRVSTPSSFQSTLMQLKLECVVQSHTFLPGRPSKMNPQLNPMLGLPQESIIWSNYKKIPTISIEIYGISPSPTGYNMGTIRPDPHHPLVSRETTNTLDDTSIVWCGESDSIRQFHTHNKHIYIYDSGPHSLSSSFFSAARVLCTTCLKRLWSSGSVLRSHQSHNRVNCRSNHPFKWHFPKEEVGVGGGAPWSSWRGDGSNDTLSWGHDVKTL